MRIAIKKRVRNQTSTYECLCPACGQFLPDAVKKHFRKGYAEGLIVMLRKGRRYAAKILAIYLMLFWFVPIFFPLYLLAAGALDHYKPDYDGPLFWPWMLGWLGVFAAAWGGFVIGTAVRQKQCEAHLRGLTDGQAQALAVARYRAGGNSLHFKDTVCGIDTTDGSFEGQVSKPLVVGVPTCWRMLASCSRPA